MDRKIVTIGAESNDDGGTNLQTRLCSWFRKRFLKMVEISSINCWDVWEVSEIASLTVLIIWFKCSKHERERAKTRKTVKWLEAKLGPMQVLVKEGGMLIELLVAGL